MKRAIISAAVLFSFSATAFAGPPRVTTDIAPIHSLVAQVMQGVGTPSIVVPASASPHNFSLRPSQAASLESADLVFWMSHELTPWLEKPLNVLADKADIVELLEVDGTHTLDFRDSKEFMSDKHDDHDEHDEDEHDDHDEPDEHDHHHDGLDPHAWLDPENAAVWLNTIAAKLGNLDPENAETYKKNASDAIAQIKTATRDIEELLTPQQDANFIVFHDAFQYFEARFNLSTVGSIALSDASRPSPARISQVRTILQEQDVACVFAEAQFDRKLIETVIEGTKVKTAQLDPLGASFNAGPDLYVNVLNDIAEQIAGCLKP